MKTLNTKGLTAYCHYWNGEEEMPSNINTDNARALWTAEKYICTYMQNMVKANNPRKSLDMIVAAYISKWFPYQFLNILADYFIFDNTYEKEVMQTIM